MGIVMITETRNTFSKEDFLIKVLRIGYDSLYKYENNSIEFLNQVERWIFDVLLINEELLEIPECVEIIDMALNKYYKLKKESLILN